MTGELISKIKELREQAGLSQTELAYIIGVSPDTVANWESGRRGLDSIERFVRLCNCLKCNPNDLIEYKDIRDKLDVEQEIDLLKTRIERRKNKDKLEFEQEAALLKARIEQGRRKRASDT